MPIADAVKPVQTVTTAELSEELGGLKTFVDGLASHFAIVSWGTPGAEADNKIAVTLQLQNSLDEDLAAKERIRLTCTEGATMDLAQGGNGAVLSGNDTDDMIIETEESNGQFDLEVSYGDMGTITVVGGPTQGSGFVDCRESVDLSFESE